MRGFQTDRIVHKNPPVNPDAVLLLFQPNQNLHQDCDGQTERHGHTGRASQQRCEEDHRGKQTCR